MLKSELVRGSPARTEGNRRVAGGLQHGASAQLARVSDAGRVRRRNRRGKRLWKSRSVENQTQVFHSAWKSRKRRGIPTFPQPRRRRFVLRRPGSSNPEC